MKVTPVNYLGWQAILLKVGRLSIHVVPQVGGRIMGVSFNGHELLYTQEKAHGFTYVFPHDQWQVYQESLGFITVGGDKTWVAPQRAWYKGVPPVVLNLSAYSAKLTRNGIVMTSAICPSTGLQIERHIAIENHQITLSEKVINRSDSVKEVGIWNVTQVRRPCVFSIPVVANRSFRSYHHQDDTLPMADELIVSGDRVTVDCQTAKLFKYGGMPKKGCFDTILPLNEDLRILWRRRFNMSEQAVYAHDSVVEIFNSHLEEYAEAEVHAPLTKVNPMADVLLLQVWDFDCSRL